MNKFLVLSLIMFFCFFSCNKKQNESPEKIKETAVAGSTTILVDETIFPLVEDLTILFENEYKRAKIKLVSSSENEILNQINANKSQIAILARDLDTTEIQQYNARQIFPKRTNFAIDGLAFITNVNSGDSTLVYSDLKALLKGEFSKTFKTIVFDNPNSSALNEMKKLIPNAKLSTQNVFSMNSNKEVIKYIAENKNCIGVVGVNWLLQPTNDLQPYLEKTKVLAVENVKLNEKNKFIKPNQTNIADKSYPFSRKIYLLNFQGTAGLGMGFASYIAGNKGQRIVLKSGLVPSRFPTREISVRKEVE